MSLGIHEDCIKVLVGEVWSELDKLLTKLHRLQAKEQEVAKGLIVGLAQFLIRNQFKIEKKKLSNLTEGKTGS